MRKAILALIVLFQLQACTSKPEQATQTYDSTRKLLTAVFWYQRSAEAKVLQKQCYELARYKFEANLANRAASDKKAAVVLDIDETVLDNSPFEVNSMLKQQAYNSKTWSQWCNKAAATAIPGALSFLEFVQEKGAEVIYVSNRKQAELDSTVANLKALGFPNADKAFVFLRTDERSKTARRKIVSEQYDIVLFLGDNLSDFSDEFDDRSQHFGLDLIDEKWNNINQRFVQLPNPMYGDWLPSLPDNSVLSPAQQDSVLLSRLVGY